MRKLHLPLLVCCSAVALAIVLALGPIPRASGDIRALFPRHSHTLVALGKMEQLFGDSLFDSIIVETKAEPDDALRGKLLDLSDALGSLDGVLRVVSPLEGYSSLGIPVRVLTPDRSRGRYLVEIDGALHDDQRVKLNVEIDRLMEQFASLNPIRAGAFYASEAATRTIDAENRKWTPISAAVLAAATWFVFGNLAVAARVLLAPVLALVWLFAGLLYLDIPLTPISQLVPPLLLAIGASYSVYLAARHLYARTKGGAASLTGATTSVMLAAGTTIVGFISLLAMDTRSVTQFGILMSIGTVLSCAFTLAITPRLMRLPAEKAAKAEERLASFEFDLKPFMNGRWMGLFVGLTLAIGTGLPRMFLDTSPLDFLPPQIPERQNLDRAAGLFPGNNMLALVIAAPGGRSLNETDLSRFADLQREVAQIRGVVSTTSAADFLELSKRVAALEAEGKGSEAGEVDPFGPTSITSEGRRATRLFVESDLEGRGLLGVRDQIFSLPTASTLLAEGFGIDAASRELVMADQSHQLAHGLLLSVVTALTLVFFLLYGVLRDIKLSVLGLVPSVLPILVVFGTLGYWYGRVNLGAAMVAAVSLGMVSDNTFHFLIAWQRCKGDGDRVARALDYSVGPFIVTAIVLIAGFSATDFSLLAPMRQFGIFLGLTIALGVITNGVLLPYALARLGRR